MSEGYKFLEADLCSSCFTNENDVNLHNLSIDICAAFEKIVEGYGKEPFISLGSLVARAMDTLHDAYKERDNIIGELERLKHNHIFLVTKRESERSEFKAMEERVFDLEDTLLDKLKTIEALQSSSAATKKLLEMKAQNATYHILRLEERDKELQATYSNLRQRYGELFRAHVELMERVRISTEESNNSNVSTSAFTKLSVSSNLEPCTSTTTAVDVTDRLLLGSHKVDSPYEWEGTHRRGRHEFEDAIPDITLDVDGSPFSKLSPDDENFDDLSNSEEKSDCDNSSLPSNQKENINKEFNASKEVSKLVNDFNELEKTNNALKIVINDLLTNAEELNREKVELKEALSQMQISRSSAQILIRQLQDENTYLKSNLAEVRNAQSQSLVNETLLSKRPSYTRDEFAKILMERNQLQEDVCDLNERLNLCPECRRCRGRTQKPLTGSKRFMIFFSRLFQRQSGKSPPTVSFDTSTSGVSMSFSESRLFDGESVNLSGSKSSRDAVKFAPQLKSWWIPLPVDAKPCPPQPVVMQSTTAVQRASLDSRCITPLPSHRQPRAFPPLPVLLYRRPVPEALVGQMHFTGATCISSDFGGSLPSGEFLVGRSSFFNASTTNSTLNPVNANLSSNFWLCLVGVTDTAASRDASGSGSDAVESKPEIYSQVVVVDAENPSRYVDSFFIKRSVVTCMSAVPGAKQRDYEVLRLSNNTWESIPFVEGSDNAPSDASQLFTSRPDEVARVAGEDENEDDEDCPASIQTNNTLSSLRHFIASAGQDIQGDLLFKSLHQQYHQQQQQQQSLVSTAATPQRTSAFEPDVLQDSGKLEDDLFFRVERQRFEKVPRASFDEGGYRVISRPPTTQQTVWLGCQNGDVFVHSCVSNRHALLQSTRLPSGVNCICHFSGRVFISLADGHIVVFRRHHSCSEVATPLRPSSPKTSSPLHESHLTSIKHQSQNGLSIEEELFMTDAGGMWDLSEAVVIRYWPVGQFPIISLTVVASALTLWAAYKNRIIVIDATNFQRLCTIEVVSNFKSIVRSMCWTRDGVWVSLRNDSTLRLFNAFTYEPMQHLNMAIIINETVGVTDLRPLSVSASVSAVAVSPDHLWVGTKGGHIVCLPFKSPLSTLNSSSSTIPTDCTASPDVCDENASPPSAQVNLSGAALSGYGHSEAVNFFTLVSRNAPFPSMPAPTFDTSSHSTNTSSPPSFRYQDLCMVSGGVGFVEHCQQDAEDGNEHTKKQNSRVQNHLLVWSVPCSGSRAN